MPNKQKQFIPQRPDDFTADWFTSVLPQSGTVMSVRVEDIGQDVGFIGEVYRCHLEWEPGVNSSPSTVIVKVPTANDENFALGDGLQLYEREIIIYQNMQSSLGLEMPGFYYAAMDPDPAPWIERPLLFLFDKLPIGGINWLLKQFLKFSGNSKRRYVLVIEDIVGARPPTQAEGGSLDDALAALKVLAQFHARNWMLKELVDEHSRLWPFDRACRAYQASYVRNLDAFQRRYRDHLGAAMLARLDGIQERAADLNHELASQPWTLLHGDYRLDNVLFRKGADGTDELVVLDYQAVCYGRPGADVAYFVTTALTAEHRSEEELLLRTYHDELVAGGVTSYSYDDLVADCSKAKEVYAHRIVGAADILDTEKSDGSEALLAVMQLRVLDWLDPA